MPYCRKMGVSPSLDAVLVARARRVAGHRGLSALVNEALRIRLPHERPRAVLAEMGAEFGPVPAEELARARAAWPERDDIPSRLAAIRTAQGLLVVSSVSEGYTR